MHIVNIMLSKGLGGIEQAFVDYTDGLMHRGHTVTPITHPKAAVNAQLAKIHATPKHLHNLGEWDPIAVYRLRAMLEKLHPNVILTHTGRSYALARRADRRIAPLVGIAHNYHGRIARMKNAEGVFVITRDIMRFALEQGIREDQIFLIPNMIECTTLPVHGHRRNPPVIGAIGRMVAKKGFDVLLDALKILHDRSYPFKAVLAGDGEEAQALNARVQALGLQGVVSMPGWLEDKSAFYETIDIFCLPSLHEPFGIVLLEAFKYGVPVVATDSEGPRDIVTPNFDALLAKKGSAEDLAENLARMLGDPALGATLATNGFIKVKTLYSMESISERIEKALYTVIKRRLA